MFAAQGRERLYFALYRIQMETCVKNVPLDFFGTVYSYAVS